MDMASADVAAEKRRFSLPAIEPPVGDYRFWLIQTLVAAITVMHGLVEWVERNQGLTGFLDGVHHLPVPAYIIPILLAGFWFGFEGGVLTGLATLVLSVPNLVLFHREDYEWFGEFVTNLLVLAVGLVVASMVERNYRLRVNAEANSRRLRTLWDVAGTLGRHESQGQIITDVVERLAASTLIRGAGYVPSGVRAPAVASGDDSALALIRHAAEHASYPSDGRATRPAGVLTFDVMTLRRRFGTLLLACAPDHGCGEDAVVFSLVANEMAAVLENLEHREAERSHLRRYARAVTLAQEKERRRIARELHDGPVQSMILLNRGLSQLADGGGGGANHGRTGELQDLVQSTLGSLQHTTQALRPLMLDDLGLVAALRSLVDRRTKRGELTVAFELLGEERRFDRDAEIAAYRIVQEALTNVARHADTDRALVRVEFLTQRCVLSIIDHGKGFDPAAEQTTERFGIVGMRERAELVGGALRIESSLGSGTKVEVGIPT